MSHQQENELLEFDWIVSLLFWLFLFVAAAIFGVLALSPKLEVYWSLQAEQKQNAERLDSLQTEITYLQHVVDALEHDPEFQAELARIDLNPNRSVADEEVLDLSLSIGPAVVQRDQPHLHDEDSSSCREGWLVSKNRSFVQDRILRNKLYLVMAGLVVFAFVFLQDNSAET
ncbi:Septum formation initiator [Polystyrenella longa]|uniref:Septum formation initiator n=1 Tax=Polystyrenella longa TaxID=2528007 RepID=A0A518CPB3_9PLAN|nr:hypothetical protein [Polystyrenella longa]QDU81060.1 Septum formation initiator [Polystyrenella longa]